MIAGALASVFTGAVLCAIFSAMFFRSAFRLRGAALRLSKHPVVRMGLSAQDLLPPAGVAIGRFEVANTRLAAAAVEMHSAFDSVSAYAGQVATMSIVIDNLLEMLVPRLRGMLAKES